MAATLDMGRLAGAKAFQAGEVQVTSWGRDADTRPLGWQSPLDPDVAPAFTLGQVTYLFLK